MRLLQPEENLIVGGWLGTKEGIEIDENLKRIEWLKAFVLQDVSFNFQLNWVKLYVDPRDGRVWELFWPERENHGGGPASLRCVGGSLDEVLSGGLYANKP